MRVSPLLCYVSILTTTLFSVLYAAIVCKKWVELICCPLCMQGNLTHPELSVAVEMLSSVALINRALDSGDVNTVWKQLSSPVTGLTNIEDENSQRWIFQAVMSVFDVPCILWLLEFPAPQFFVFLLCYLLWYWFNLCWLLRLVFAITVSYWSKFCAVSVLSHGFQAEACCGTIRLSVMLCSLTRCVLCPGPSFGALVLLAIVSHLG